MKRRLLIAAIFLLAGTVVNVAVAWGCAVAIQFSEAGPYPYDKVVRARHLELGPDGGCRYWSLARLKVDGVLCYTSYWDNRRDNDIDCSEVEATTLRPEQLAPSWARLRRSPDTDTGWRWVHAYGWPVVSLWSDYGVGADGNELLHGLPVTFLPPNGAFPRAVPLLPIWPGFAVNTLFYATILCLLLGGPFVLRRLIRLKRGRCVQCGYPMGESAVCSECGKALPRRARATT